MNGPQEKKSSPAPSARRAKISKLVQKNISMFGVGLTKMGSMASTTASRAAAAEARHGLRHEAADVTIAELDEEAIEFKKSGG